MTASRNAAKRVALVVLDGWGYRAERDGNAIALAHTPTWDKIWSSPSRTLLEASGLTNKTPVSFSAAIEQGTDESGIVWPRAISPWGIHLVSLAKADEPEREAADRLYEELCDAGVEVIYDDRDAGPGEKLTDAELLGCPLRLVAGRRGLAEGMIEAQVRRSGEERKLAVGEAAAGAREMLESLE